MNHLIREPLVHFALASLVLFVVHGLWTANSNRADTTITVTESELKRLAALYASEAGALPNADDLNSMIADHVRDQALAREARRLGLDRGDTVVERRLAQKMTFLVSDLATIPSPTDETLREWFQTHSKRFEVPARLTFDHVYFSTERRGDQAQQNATAALANLNSRTPTPWKQTGDPFMLSRSYGDLPIREVARIFGAPFSEALMNTPAVQIWAGPIKSAFGFHLVRVTKSEPTRLPPFQEVRIAVKADWTDAKRRQKNADAIATIVSKYTVIIEDPSDD